MTQWRKIDAPELPGAGPERRAVAYYRHSAQVQQEQLLQIQRDQVQEWARTHGFEILQGFTDAGSSTALSDDRPAFTEMMDEWVKKRTDFSYILCLDVSRWGRFQDIDLSAQFSAECRKNNKQVIYTTIGKPREDDPLYPVYVQFERFRAAQYSRELSDKVWRGCVKITEQGYWAGGSPPYGTRRLLLDEKRDPLHPLEPGQRNGIQNQRVTLVEGDPAQVAVNLEQARPSSRPRNLNRDKIIEKLQQRHAAGLSLAWNVVCFENRVFAVAAKQLFRSWGRALEAAGLVPEHIATGSRRIWDRQRILAAIRLRQQEGKTLQCSRVRQEDAGLVSAARRYYSTWAEAVAAAMNAPP